VVRTQEARSRLTRLPGVGVEGSCLDGDGEIAGSKWEWGKTGVRPSRGPSEMPRDLSILLALMKDFLKCSQQFRIKCHDQWHS